MNTLKTAILLLGILTALPGCAQTPAQTDPANRREQLLNSTPEQRATRQTQQMKQALALTAEQEKTIAAINLKYARQMQPVIDQRQRNRETMKQVRMMAQERDAELSKVLTDSQLKQYNEQRDDRRDRLRDRRN
jgi:Spy/CpxP family protein refolding chaperone